MPNWMISALLPFVVGLIKKYGIPAIEAKWPSLTPIIEEILRLLGQSPTSRSAVPPSPELKAASDHYNRLCEGVACPSDTKGLG